MGVQKSGMLRAPNEGSGSVTPKKLNPEARKSRILDASVNNLRRNLEEIMKKTGRTQLTVEEIEGACNRAITKAENRFQIAKDRGLIKSLPKHKEVEKQIYTRARALFEEVVGGIL